MLNTMIGSSIFGLPSLIAARLGKLSPVAYLVAVAGVGVIAACLAEVASQFREAGGPYLYARTALGPFVGIQIGWLTWISRIAAAAAVTNLFISYLTEFFPKVSERGTRAGIIAVLIGFLAVVNYRGVANGNRLSGFFTGIKLVLLVAFTGGGLLALALHPATRVTPPEVHVTAASWFDAVILLVYSYGGFEAALVICGETRDPRRDAPFGLLVSLITTTVLYIAVQYVVIHTLVNAATSNKAVVDSAKHFLGPVGVTLVTAGTLASAYGYLSANMLHTPRITYAMAERGDFPEIFGQVHERFRTPYVSIVAFAVLTTAFSIGGDFRWNAILAAVSRLFIYAAVAAALPVLRKKHPGAEKFRLPGAPVFVALALVFTGVLVTRMHTPEIVVMLVTLGIGSVNWILVKRRGETRTSFA